MQQWGLDRFTLMVQRGHLLLGKGEIHVLHKSP